MDERTRLLVSLGAAVAANCVSCFEHYLGKTDAVGLTSEEIQETVDVADQVRSGARVAILTRIRGMLGAGASPCSSKSDRPCCG